MSEIQVRAYTQADLPDMIRIWNEVVEDGIAFPQEENLLEETGKEFFGSQTYSAVAEDTATGEILGLYILHPNNVGRRILAIKYCSSMRLWLRMYTQGTCTSVLDLCSWGLSRAASG